MLGFCVNHLFQESELKLWEIAVSYSLPESTGGMYAEFDFILGVIGSGKEDFREIIC